MNNSKLSPHDKRVLGLMFDGKPNKEIAAEVHCTLPAVKRSLTRIYQFYGVHSSRGLFRISAIIFTELKQR